MALAKNLVYHKRMKHIDIQHHFIRVAIENKHITLSYCPIEEMAVDMLTKELGKMKHDKCCAIVGIALSDAMS